MEKIKILLIEDNPGDAVLLSEILKESKDITFEINHAHRLEEALKASKDSFDIILSDLSLPDSSGLNTYRNIRKQFPAMPIVILSGNLDESVAVTAVREGAQDYLIKGQPDSPTLTRCIRYSIERKRSEQEIEQMRVLQQNSAKMASLGEMAGGVAHEINTPLGSILLTSQALKGIVSDLDTPSKKTLVEMVDLIEKTTNRISKIVRSLKTFSRGSSDAPFIETRLWEIVDGAVTLCTEKFSQLGVDLKIKISESDETKLQCRESEISQVILNLLTNARDAVEPLNDKWVQLDYKNNGNTIQIRITDSGPGIPKEIQDRIFNPFFTSKEIGKGTGLGLSISKGIIESHGGSLTLDTSSPNTTFIINLPKIQQQSAEALFKEK